MGKRATQEADTQWKAHDEVGASLLRIPGVAAGMAQQAQISRLGRVLREIRESHLKMTQTEAAHLLGMPQSELSRIEAGTGARGPTFATVVSILDHYEQSLAPSGTRLTLSLGVSVQSAPPIHYGLAGNITLER